MTSSNPGTDKGPRPAENNLPLTSTNSLGVVILAHNEERHIARAIGSVAPVATQVFVIDSFSTDRTVEIARELGAIVVTNSFVNYAVQFQWALDNLPIETDWIMRLDADEILTGELCEEISQEIALLTPEISGINLKRRHIFMSRWIKHGGRYPLTLLRVWRRGAARIEQRWMDEHMVLLTGKAVTFKHDFCDHNLNDLNFFIEKHSKYATREAIDRLNEQFDLFKPDDSVSRDHGNSQARLKRLAKEKFYNHLPFGVGPFGYFVWRYICQAGFLDGTEGLIYHFLQGFWYRFLVEAKVVELRRSVAHLHDRDAIKAELSRITGLSIV